MTAINRPYMNHTQNHSTNQRIESRMESDRLATAMQLAELIEAARTALKTARRDIETWDVDSRKWIALAEDEVNFAQNALSHLSVWQPSLF